MKTLNEAIKVCKPQLDRMNEVEFMSDSYRANMKRLQGNMEMLVFIFGGKWSIEADEDGKDYITYNGEVILR